MHCNCDRMIGYDDAACALRSSTFGRSSLPPLLGNVQCTGAERSLDMCNFEGSSNTVCGYYYDNTGVVCFNSKLLSH